jgi:UDP-N-acetylglucosamine 4,6-dehydratase
MLNGKRILITGGTGSLGKKLIQIITQNYKVKELIVFSRDELKQFEMSQKWSIKKYPFLTYILGDVRDKDRLMLTFRNIDYIIHAAALKQVPAAEKNPCEYIKTNVLGAMNIIDAAIYNKVKKVIALSTDKACDPINLYGATKLCADKLFTAANTYNTLDDTKFSVVRYGNVVASRGSVIPFFKERAKTGKLPITDKRMTRFWITLDQAAHFVLKCLERMNGEEIFVPKIPSMKIIDLGRAIAPKCKFEIIGIRPGEKLHETLISENDARNTIEFKECYVVNSHMKKNIKSGNIRGNICPEGFKYTSDRNEEWITPKELESIIENISDDYSIEKSRWAMDDIPQ